MNILMITQVYAMNTIIGSIRPTQFSKTFANEDHNVTVITIGHNNKILDLNMLSELKKNIKIIEIGYETLKEIETIYDKEKKEIKKDNMIIKYLIRIIKNSYTSFLKKEVLEMIWCNRVKEFAENNFHKNEFDIIFSTSPSSMTHQAAIKVNKIVKAKWIADFRDPIVNSYHHGIIKFLLGIRQRYYCKKADAVTVVSKGVFETFKKHVDCNIHYLPNGFDFWRENKQRSINSKISLCYTGILYQNSDLSMLFDVIKELIDENNIDRNSIVFHYAGKDQSTVLSQASRCDLESIVNYVGLIPREETFKLQSESDMLVIASWNNKNNLGVIPAKLYEYISAKKPIISLVSGDIPDAELSEMVKGMNLGVSCEYINYEKSKQELKEFLICQFESIRNSNCTVYHPDYEKAEFFKRDNISKNMLNLFEQLENEKVIN